MHAAAVWLRSPRQKMTDDRKSSKGGSKGGARRAKCEEVDREHLGDILKQYCQWAGPCEAYSFEPYGTRIQRQSAVAGSVLSKHLHFLERISEASSSLRFKYSDLKAEVAKTVDHFPSIRQHRPQAVNQNFAADVAATIMIMCSHVRRLKDERKYQEATSKCTEKEISNLAKLRELALDIEQGHPSSKEDSQEVVLPEHPSSSNQQKSTSKEKLEKFGLSPLREVMQPEGETSGDEDEGIRDTETLPEIPKTPLLTQESLQESAEAASPTPARKANLKKVLKRPAAAVQPKIQKKPAGKELKKKPAQAEKKMDRKNIHSRAWHQAKIEGKDKGLEGDELKKYAQRKAKEALRDHGFT